MLFQVGFSCLAQFKTLLLLLVSIIPGGFTPYPTYLPPQKAREPSANLLCYPNPVDLPPELNLYSISLYATTQILISSGPVFLRRPQMVRILGIDLQWCNTAVYDALEPF